MSDPMKRRVSFPRGHTVKPGCHSVVFALKGECGERIEFAGDLPKDVAAKALAVLIEAAGIKGLKPKPAADHEPAPQTKRLLPLTTCAANREGDCSHPECPQHRDGEPAKSRRHCPLDTASDE